MGDKDGKAGASVRRSQRNKDQDDDLSINTRGQHGAGGDDDGETIHQKLDRITAMLSDALRRLDIVESELRRTNQRVNIVEDSMQNFNETLEEVIDENKQHAKITDVEALRKKVDDLENRQRRNNVVFWGFPESTEKEECKELITNFLQSEMNLDNVEIERAHRSPMGKFNAQGERQDPRPIHVKFLRYNDIEEVLRTAPKALKEKLFKGRKIFISDDVSEAVRKDRKKLITLRNKLRDEGKFASVLWSVPACLLTKKANETFKRFFVDDLPE